MQAYPNNKPWAVDLVGFYERGDWYGSGNAILWDDGTVWVYGCEMPILGDQWGSGGYPSGFSIHERKSGSDFWERLLPDTWGDPVYADPPGYPDWFPVSRFTMDVQTSVRSAPLNVARIGGISQGETNIWHLPPNGDEVIFTERFGSNAIWPIAINKSTRRWRVLWDEDPAAGLMTRIWWEEARASNVVLYEDYYWFLAVNWVPDPGTNNYGVPNGSTTDYTKGLQLVRAPVSNIQDVRVIHQFPYVAGWLDNHITTDINIPEFFNNNYMTPVWPYGEAQTHIAMGDGKFYVFNEALVKDQRTTASNLWGSPGAVNYNMEVGYVRQSAIGDWDNLKVVYYHSNQGWVGYSRPIGGTESSSGTMNSGSIGSFQDSEGYGSGFALPDSFLYSVQFNDGFLYFWLMTGMGGNQAGGSPFILCRMDVSGLNPESPRAYERDSPYYEVIGNGTGDWEGSFSKRYWGYGNTLFMRYGSQAIYPWPDFGGSLQFDSEGGIWITGFQYLFHYPYGPISFNSGYPYKVLLRLRPPDNETRVTLTFTGTAYQGYTAVRETGSRTREIELELGNVQPV